MRGEQPHHMNEILIMTGWRARAACYYIKHRSEAMRLGLRLTERVANDCLLGVMKMEATR